MRKFFAFSWVLSLVFFGELQAAALVQQDQLELYVMESCPYCQKVHNALKELGVTIATKDISKNPEYKKELIRIGGKKQVPCLVINNKALYESDAIVAWLKSNCKK